LLNSGRIELRLVVAVAANRLHLCCARQIKGSSVLLQLRRVELRDQRRVCLHSHLWCMPLHCLNIAPKTGGGVAWQLVEGALKKTLLNLSAAIIDLAQQTHAFGLFVIPQHTANLLAALYLIADVGDQCLGVVLREFSCLNDLHDPLLKLLRCVLLNKMNRLQVSFGRAC